MSESAKQEVSYQLTKIARKGRPLIFQSMKPPQLRRDKHDESSAPVPHLVGVSRGVEIHVRVDTDAAGKSLYNRVNGQRLVRKAHTGLDNRIFHHFVVWRDPKTNIAEAVDKINIRLQSYHTGEVQLNRDDKDLVHCYVDRATGELDIVYAPQLLVRVEHLEAFALAAGPLAGFNVGDMVGSLSVSRITGDTVYLAPTGSNQDAPATF